MRRPWSWDDVWWGVARCVAEKSSCTLAQVGAVIVTPTNRVVATGYNGPPANLASERFLGQTASCAYECPRAQPEAEIGTNYQACLSIHAEANALLFADRRDVEGGTLYCTHVPCPDCQKLIANSGVVRVVCWDDGSPHRTMDDARKYLSRNGIRVDLAGAV